MTLSVEACHPELVEGSCAEALFTMLRGAIHDIIKFSHVELVSTSHLLSHMLSSRLPFLWGAETSSLLSGKNDN
jgi:hypothetical protein